MTTDGAAETGSRSRRSRAVCIALLVTAAFAFAWMRAPLLSVPLERDEGEYAYIAQRMLAGDVPYVDAFDQKPPAIFLAYRIAFALFGESTEAIHGFLYLWTALTVVVFHRLVRRLEGPLAAAFAAAVFAVASGASVLTANAANTEVFMLLPMVGSVAGMLRALDAPFAWRNWILCGALGALACWFKPVALCDVAFVAAVPAVVSLRGRDAGRYARLARIYTALAIGGGAVTGAAVGWLAANGAFEAFVDAVLLHNLDYSQGNSLASGLAALQRRIGEQAPAFAAYWIAAALGLFVPGLVSARTRAVLSGWLVASAAGASIGLYFRPHYFYQVLPALSALAGCGLAGVAARGLRSASGAKAVAIVVALAAVALAGPPIADADLRRAGSPEAISRAIYGVNPFVESAEIGKYIRRTSAPDDTIYIVGSEPQILFYAGRASATRYIFIYPLTGNYPGVRDRQREVTDAVDAARPQYVVWSNIATSTLRGSTTDPFLFEHARAMLDRDYRLEFVAHPVVSDAQFEFAYGTAARRLMRRAGDRAEEAPWIALYRRRSDAR